MLFCEFRAKIFVTPILLFGDLIGKIEKSYWPFICIVLLETWYKLDCREAFLWCIELAGWLCLNSWILSLVRF